MSKMTTARQNGPAGYSGDASSLNSRAFVVCEAENELQICYRFSEDRFAALAVIASDSQVSRASLPGGQGSAAAETAVSPQKTRNSWEKKQAGRS